jgi:hypothetical protein
MGRRNIKREMMLIKGGDFPKWYESLNDKEKKEYKLYFEQLQEKWEGRIKTS